VYPDPSSVASPSSPARGERKPSGNGFDHGVSGSTPFGANATNGVERLKSVK
jgi:hypothetical protein